ncbi:MAG: putative DNA binding domain-containing protein [Prevotellaceae bacterium]|jgi:hypothetical protein|nr:putative DNA binding domain-containing protein [Prevotellaceae bacterium]
MTEKEIYHTFESLLCQRSENEITEFKHTEKNYDFNKLGKYFSALSNETNLQKCSDAWLVFGVFENKKTKQFEINGTPFRINQDDLQSLKKKLPTKPPIVLLFEAFIRSIIQPNKVKSESSCSKFHLRHKVFLSPLMDITTVETAKV